MFSKVLFVLAAVTIAINAQTDNVSPCIFGCVIPAAAQNGCTSVDDFNCLCTNSQFESDVGACLQQHCTPDEFKTAFQLQQQVCTSAGVTPTFSSTPTPKPVSFTSVTAIPTRV